MRKVLSAFVAVLATVFCGMTAQAEVICSNDWKVSSNQTTNFVNLKITEAITQGPACDLIVKSFNYIEGLEVLALEIAPVRFCPMDAIKNREARFAWALPYPLNAKGNLKVSVNGLQVGTVHVQSGNVTFEGGCH